jgi:predicted ester cyclase
MKNLCMILPLALILCFMVGCQDKEAMAELEEFRAQAEVEEQNKEIMIRWLEEMDKGNLAIYDEICTEDYTASYSWLPEPLNVEAAKQALKSQMIAFPDYNHTVEDIIAKDNKVVIRVTNRGTHNGELGGMPPTGNEIEFSVIFIGRFVDGKVAEAWAEANILGFYQQLGMELKPKEEVK